jgi:hypothetical protein
LAKQNLEGSSRPFECDQKVEEFCAKNRPQFDEEEWERLYLPADEDDLKQLLDTPKIPLLWDSEHVTRRIAAQRSRFMIFGSDPDWLIELQTKNVPFPELKPSALTPQRFLPSDRS